MSCGACPGHTKSSFGERAIARALEAEFGTFTKAENLLRDYHNMTAQQALDLDAYSSALNIGVEFNGADHYRVGRGGKAGLESRRRCDRRRRRLCKQRGIHLIEIHHKDYDRDPEGTIKKLIEEIRAVAATRTPNLSESAT